jgi:integrase
MLKHNAQNERIKHKYRVFMQEARGYGDATIDIALASINHYEAHTKLKPFRLFHIDDARSFSRHLLEATNRKTGKPYAKSTLKGTFAALKKFFQWFAAQPESGKRIGYGDADYFRLNRKDEAIARATRTKRVPSVEEVKRVLLAMPSSSETELRDRALIAFTLLTGARKQAIVTARVKHVDLATLTFHQDSRDVHTKFAKTFDTFFFPVGDEVVAMLEDWISHLIAHKRFGPDDPLFPKQEVGYQSGAGFSNAGLGRENYASDGFVGEVFKAAFKEAGLPPANPHILRDTLTQLGQRLCKTPEDLKAWSQNLGHEDVLTTFTSYGKVHAQRQAELIAALGTNATHTTNPGKPDAATIAHVLQHLQGQQAERKL